MKAPAPPLSVVVPSRNTRRLTLACLASLAAAAARPELASMEVVLVDDAGSDGTAEAVAERFPRVRLLRLGERAGFTRAANRGMAAAAGELLLLLNSDTEVEPAGLAALPAAFAAAPRLGIAGGALRYPDGTPQWSGGGEPTALWLLALASGLPALLGRVPPWRRLRPASGSGRGAGAVAWVTGAAMAVRRAAWEQVGPFDERFAFYAQDLDLCLRARDAGWEVAILPGLRVVHHHGATIAGEGAPAGGGQGSPGSVGPPGAVESPGAVGSRSPGAIGPALFSGSVGSDSAVTAGPVKAADAAAATGVAAPAATGVAAAAAGGGEAGSPTAPGAQHLELLWTDLVRWAGKRGGPAAARRAARALLAGGTLRRLGCSLLAVVTPGAARRAGLRARAAALGAALEGAKGVAAATMSEGRAGGAGAPGGRPEAGPG